MTKPISENAKDNLTGICGILLNMSTDMIAGLNAGFNMGYQAAQANEKGKENK